MSYKQSWWGYLHESGTLHVKRFSSISDLVEANESPFVAEWCGPWVVEGRKEALKKLKEDLATLN